jgi:hypothetical protein
MPHRINVLALASFACLLVALQLGTQGPVSAADDCLERAGPPRDHAGHWYYHIDWGHSRKCWYFKPATATIPNPSPNEQPSTNESSEQSFLSRLATGVQQTFRFGTQKPEPQYNPTTQTNSPEPQSQRPTEVPKQRSRVSQAPKPHDAAPSGSPISPAVRDALFQEFLRRYQIEKSFSSSPPP